MSAIKRRDETSSDHVSLPTGLARAASHAVAMSRADLMQVGDVISHYRIISKLGQGGMGVVYLAEDTRLERSVALKFLPAHLSIDAESRSRFIREAKAASALNHPAVCTIHDIGGTEDGRTYIAMAHYEGRTLRELLESGAMEREQALDLAAQIADGLTAAHAKGITHRDIKPANILVTNSGRAVILDFGLAKVADTMELTQAGTTMGTAYYMSPEQIRGESVDHRTDIWSLGVMLFEMVCGRRPFGGEYEQAVVYAILNTQPSQPEHVDNDLWKAIAKALEKDPTDRRGSMNQFRDGLLSLSRHSAVPSAATRKKSVRFALLASSVAVIAIALVWLLVQDRNPDTYSERLPGIGKVQFRQITSDAAVEEFPAFDPGGSRMAFSRETDGYRHIFVRNLETGTDEQLTFEQCDDIQPSWSVTGQSLAFVRSNDPSGKIEPGDVFAAYLNGDIWKYDFTTGNARRIIDDAFNPSFSPDGSRIVFDADWAGPRRIWVSDAEGRNPQQLTSDVSEELTHVSPRWSPDGKFVAFVNIERTKFDIHLVDIQLRDIVPLTDDVHTDVYPVFSAEGSGVFFASNRSAGMNVWFLPIASTGRPLGQPRQVSTGAGSDVQLSITGDGSKIAYSVLGLNADLWRLPVDPRTGIATGDPEPIAVTTREDSRGSWSHGNGRIAFNSDRSGDMNIWVLDLNSAVSTQITSGSGGDYQPRWAPDDKSVVFFSSRSGNADIWTADLETGALTQLTTDESLDLNPVYSPDGTSIAFHTDRSGRVEVWAMRRDGSEQTQLTTIGAAGHFLVWNERGDRVVFASDHSGVRMAMLASVDARPEEPLVPVRGGSHMSWSPDYQRIADVTGHKTIWITALDGGEPIKSFESDDLEVRIDYPVWSHDGQWILFDRVRPSGGDIWVMDLN